MEGYSRETLARPDGTELVWFLGGQPRGEAVVLCDGLGCDGFAWRRIAPVLEPSHRVLHPHYRGHGESGLAGGVDRMSYRRDAGDGYAMPVIARDVLACMDAAGVERAVFFGHSMGVQIALECALLAPERVTGLVLVCGSPGRPLDTVGDSDVMKRLLPMARRLVEAVPDVAGVLTASVLPTEVGWRLARLLEVDGRLLQRGDFMPYLEHMARMDPRVFLETMDAAGRHSTSERLEQIDTPALVVGGERDGFTPFWVSELLGEKLPDARTVMLRGGTHTAHLEQWELFERLVREFMGLEDAATSRAAGAPA